MEALFLVKDPSQIEERTFQQEENLPPLPVPKLEETLEKYLDSCKAALSSEEFKKTESVVKNFAENEGPILQERLVRMAATEKNWLEEWWLNGYLDYRGPLGGLNFSGTTTYDFWPSTENTQLERAAMGLHNSVRFWKHLCDETFKQMKDRKGNTLSMQQLRYIFNTCRIPGKGRDKLVSYFKTIHEGESPSHFIVFYHQRMYKVSAKCKTTGELYSPVQFRKILSLIKNNIETGQGVAALSEMDRETWAEARKHLISLSSKNEHNLKDIESAIMGFSLVDDCVKDDSALMTLSSTGVCGNRWSEKYNQIWSADGRVCNCTEHTPSEGMSFVALMTYNETLVREKLGTGKWKDVWMEDEKPVEQPEELIFDLDEKMKQFIVKGREVDDYFKKYSEYLLFDVDTCGKNKLKSLQVHPCAFSEACIQLAYMRKHGKPGSAYETASARGFYHGRTETLRSCTPELVEFCNAMINDLPNTRELFVKACEKYMWLMKESALGKGCDRHLLGLSEVAKEKGGKLPEIFTDDAYNKTGGNANFILSTSCSGYTPSAGATIPMREDGYGIFFRFSNHKMHFSVTTFKPTEGVDAKSMAEYLKQSVADVHTLITTTPTNE